MEKSKSLLRSRGYNHIHSTLFLFIFILWDVTDHFMTLKMIPPIYWSLHKWYYIHYPHHRNHQQITVHLTKTETFSGQAWANFSVITGQIFLFSQVLTSFTFDFFRVNKEEFAKTNKTRENNTFEKNQVSLNVLAYIWSRLFPRAFKPRGGSTPNFEFDAT